MKCLVPDPQRLAHSIKTVVKLPYMGFLVRQSKSRRLFHALHFIFQQNTVEECNLHVVLLNAPIIYGGSAKHDVQGFSNGLWER
jgi:hypothetical protein